MASPFPNTKRCGRGGSGFTTPARDRPTYGYPLGSRLRQGSQPVEELTALPSWVENDLKMLVYYPMPRRLTQRPRSAPGNVGESPRYFGISLALGFSRFDREFTLLPTSGYPMK